MKTRRIYLLFIIAIIVPAILTAGSLITEAVDTGRLELDPAYIATGGLTDPDGSFIFNPANVARPGWEIETPYLAVSLTDPVDFLTANSLHSMGPQYPEENRYLAAETGFSFRVPYFGMNMRLAGSLPFRSVPYVHGGYVAYPYLDASSSMEFAGGGHIRTGMDSYLNIGGLLGITARALVSLPVDYKIDNACHDKALLDLFRKSGPVISIFEVPFSVGLSWNWNRWINVSAAVRSDRLFSFSKMIHDSVNDFGHTAIRETGKLFNSSFSANWQEITADIGFAAYHTKAVRNNVVLGFRTSVELNDLTGLILEPSDWAGHLIAGAEGSLNNITLRAGFNRGPVVGIGLDFIYFNVDVALRNVMFPERNREPYQQLVIACRAGK